MWSGTQWVNRHLRTDYTEKKKIIQKRKDKKQQQRKMLIDVYFYWNY